MAFKFILAVFSVFAVSNQAIGACVPPPPACGSASSSNLAAMLGALAAPGRFSAPAPAPAPVAAPAPGALAGLLKALAAAPAPAAWATSYAPAPAPAFAPAPVYASAPAPVYSSAPAPVYASAPAPHFTSVPAPVPSVTLPVMSGSVACQPTPTRLTNKPDVNIPLPLPDEVPIGRYCACQKFSIKPTLVKCSPVSQCSC